MTDPVQEALEVLKAMKESQPGPHVDVLERGFHALWVSHQENAANSQIVKAQLEKILQELTANIPLSAANPEWDPNDQFKAAAIDRMERVEKWANKLRVVLDPDVLRQPGEWCADLGINMKSPTGWTTEPTTRGWHEPINRAEFLARATLSDVSFYNWSPFV